MTEFYGGSVGVRHCRRFQILLQCPIIFTVLTVAVMVATVEGDFRPFSVVLADFGLDETGAF